MDTKSINFKKTDEATLKCLQSNAVKTKFANGRRLAEMCCVDLESFNVVERTGFRNLINNLDPTFSFPTSRTLATSALDDIYTVYVETLKKKLASSPQYQTLVLDMWTDNFKKISYINIKIHFCEDFELKVYSLTTEHFPRPHNNKAVTEKITSALSRFGLEGKTLTAVSDGGSNIVASLKRQHVLRYHCLAHTMHLFLTHDVLKKKEFLQIQNIIKKLKEIFKNLRFRGEDFLKLQQLKNKIKIKNFRRNPTQKSIFLR